MMRARARSMCAVRCRRCRSFRPSGASSRRSIATCPSKIFHTLEHQVALNIQSDRAVLEIAAAFAISATVLAMLGLYGVMAYSVTRRTREIGVRMALGAGRDRIRALILREVLSVLAAGVIIGIPAALGAARLSASLLYGVKPSDPLVIAAVVAALSVAALAAGYIPMRRAAAISALEALRYE